MQILKHSITCSEKKKSSIHCFTIVTRLTEVSDMRKKEIQSNNQSHAVHMRFWMLDMFPKSCTALVPQISPIHMSSEIKYPCFIETSWKTYSRLLNCNEYQQWNSSILSCELLNRKSTAQLACFPSTHTN